MKVNLSTKIEWNSSDIQLNPEAKILTIGSCFSEHIGCRLIDVGFQTLSNPFGTLYNPVSIAKLIGMLGENQKVSAQEITNHEDRFFHYDFHSSFDSLDAQSILDNLNKNLESAGRFLREADVLIITLGSSYVYELIEESRIVANCHKMPNKLFTKKLLTIEQSIQSLTQASKAVHNINPDCKILYTVSPVRHTKDGIIENTRSKARLLEACHRLCDNSKSTEYFPSYEIMMDELRDYRYYKEDLIHPTEVAVDIIWQYFREQHLTSSAKEMADKVSKLRAEANHRPFNPSSEGHQKFITKHKSKVKDLQKEFPWIDF